jgi:hypothetical protein
VCYRATVSRDALKSLHNLTDADRAPPAPSLCVEGKRPVASKLAARLLVDPGLSSKYLLYGARGGGKSTQMHDLKRRLTADLAVVDIDLDRSGVAIAGITAFDLMYIVGTAALRLVASDERNKLHQGLTLAYASDEERDALGKVDQALDGIAGFGDAVVAGALVAGAITAPAALAVAGVKAVKHVLRLRRGSREVIAATSPPGRQMQDAVEAAFDAARRATGRFLAVLVDGLEKVNGGAAEWMRNTFENTRLLTDTSVTVVVAAPPCPFTDTNSARDLGWQTSLVYGFAPDDLPSLEEALLRRVKAAGIDPDAIAVPALCARLASESGGHPRHAMQLLHECTVNALTEGRDHLDASDVTVAVTALREQLEMGLAEPSYVALDLVDRHHRLPGDELAPRLFSDGRILVHPPTDASAHSFHVHPQLHRALAQYRDSIGPSA